MRRYIGYWLWIPLLLISADAFGRSVIVPFGRPRTVGFSSADGKVYTYHALSKNQAMGFAVEGPVQVDIRTRAGIPGEQIQAEYQIQVWEGEYLVKAEKFRSKAIDSELRDSDLLPGAYRSLSFEAGFGIHNYRLWLVSDNIDTVLVRLYKNDVEDEEDEPDIEMQLLGYKRLVHLYSKKNQTPYYLVDKESGARFKVTGPTELIIRARANFTNSMDGRIGYTLSVMENGGEVETLSATTSKSLTMEYQDYTGVVPSRPNVFIVNVPAGDHVYTVILKESAAETVSVRFSLPKQN